MKQTTKIMLTFTSISLVCGGLFYWKFFPHSHSTSYTLATVSRGTIEVKVLATGTVSPENRLDIKPPVAGRIDIIVKDEGAEVKKGDTLAWMSSTERAALIDSARSRGSAELEKWEQLYKPIPVLAPVSGVIIVRRVDNGQVFSAGEVLYTMSDRLIVKAQLDETDIAQIKLKQEADIFLDAYPDNKIPGSVDLIAFDANTVNNVTTYNVNVLPKDVPSFMRSGMTANILFHIRKKENVLLVPTEALRVKEGRFSIMTGDEKAMVEKTIEIGTQDGKDTELLSGLNEGDRIFIIRENGRKIESNPFNPFGRRGKRH